MTQKKNTLPLMATAIGLPPARDANPPPVEMPNPGRPPGPPPVEMPVPPQAPPPIAENPIEADLRRSKQQKPHAITTRAFDYFYDRAEQHFVRLNSMGAALKRAGRELRERVVENDGVFDLRPPNAIERYLASRALHARRATAWEPAEVATRRRDWDEAKRSGDPDAMTRTANALIRAAGQRHAQSNSHEAAHSPYPAPGPTIEEILNPRDAQSDADMPPGETARLPQSDDEMPPGELARVSDYHALYPISIAGDEFGTGVDAGLHETARDSRSWLHELEQRFGRAPVEGEHWALTTTVGSMPGEVLPLSASSSPPRRTDEFYDVREAQPARQRRYKPREQTWEEWFWDWRWESWGGPKDTFTSEPKDDRPPFDPRAGYEDRLASRWKEVGPRFNRISGVDIDGESYTSTLMVGSNLDGKTAQGLSPEGIKFLANVLSDRVLRFRTAEEAADFLVKAERAAGKTVTAAERRGWVDTIKSGRGLTVELLKGDGTSGDVDQTIILIDSAFDGLVPEGRRTAEAVVLAHEVGHVATNVLKIDEVVENLPAHERDRVAKEMERAFRASRISQGYRVGESEWDKDPQEWFAEVFMLYLTSPESAKRDAPLTCSILRSLWNKHPVLSQILRLS